VEQAQIVSGRTERVIVDPSGLRPSLEDVTRCAASPDYKPRESIRAAIERMLQSDVIGQIEPQFCYAGFAVAGPSPVGVRLVDGRDVEITPAESDAAPAVLVAAICTVGEVDDRLEGLVESQGPLDAWIGQGIALAQLELLERACMRHIVGSAAAVGLDARDYIEPNIGSRSQQDLFSLLDAALTPVRLTQYGTMRPRMSYSFWVPLSRAAK